VAPETGNIVTETPVSPVCGQGTLRLDVVDDDTIQDLAGHPLGGLCG